MSASLLSCLVLEGAWQAGLYAKPRTQEVVVAQSQAQLSKEEVKKLVNEADRLKKIGDYASAAAIWERLVNAVENDLGPEDPITASFLNNLAELYREQGLYKQAEPLYIRSLAIFEK
ncbi:MAG: tetratricopeptide repeat protein, partial [Prochlorococcus sp.]